MILLVPVTPEVPKERAPKLWPGLLFALILGIVFLECHEILMQDYKYVEGLTPLINTKPDGSIELKPEAHRLLKLRPLSQIVPSRGDWDLKRLVVANFVHGSVPHLLLNAIGVFAGARICTTFLSFPAVFFIFIVGGTLGLFASTFSTSQLSDYIPHLGASAGIFALMGAYYVFNFHFRTKYFFWFPSRKGLVALRTSWFLFLDVILLEIVLSAAQLFPGQGDVVDHFAHVVGFGAGALLALAFRVVRRWPSELQSRGEFLYYKEQTLRNNWLKKVPPLERWLALLEINRYNDKLKLLLFEHVRKQPAAVSDADLQRAFRVLGPVFIRLYPAKASAFVRSVMKHGKGVPKEWLLTIPYDCIIQMARFLAAEPSEQMLLFEFVSQYRRAHPEGGDIDRKLELLMNKLSSVIPISQGGPPAGTPHTETANSTRPPAMPNLDRKKATSRE